MEQKCTFLICPSQCDHTKYFIFMHEIQNIHSTLPYSFFLSLHFLTPAPPTSFVQSFLFFNMQDWRVSHLLHFTFMHFLHFWDGTSKLSILQWHTVCSHIYVTHWYTVQNTLTKSPYMHICLHSSNQLIFHLTQEYEIMAPIRLQQLLW